MSKINFQHYEDASKDFCGSIKAIVAEETDSGDEINNDDGDTIVLQKNKTWYHRVIIISMVFIFLYECLLSRIIGGCGKINPHFIKSCSLLCVLLRYVV